MNHLIERYVYDVARRLPEKDRDEVNKELTANIYDMLSEHADEKEIEAVLYQLGSPALLAEKYRVTPRYLISPAIFDEYVRILKWFLPFIGAFILVIGMILGGIDAIKDGMVDFPYFIRNVLSNGISMSLSAVFQSLMWITIGFAIAERTGSKTGKGKEHDWTIKDLPDILPDTAHKIPLSDTITELILTVLFSAFVIAYCSGIVPIAFSIQTDDVFILNFFSPDFLKICIPAIAVMALLDIGEYICKIKERRWTPLVCAAVIVNSLINMVILLYLLNRPNILSTELQAFLQSMKWGSHDLLLLFGKTGMNLNILVFSIIIVLCTLIKCGGAIYKTLKNKNAEK